MGKYQTSAQRQYRYQRIAEAEGDRCIICWVEKGVRKGPPSTRLEIDHADGDPTNWSWGNLHLVCHRDNCRLREMPLKARVTTLRSYSDQVERERERENKPTWATILKDEIPYEYGPPEMRANKVFLKRWLFRVHQILKEEGSEKKKDLIARSAHFAKCSKQTSTNYLEVYASIDGPFLEIMDNDGSLIITYRQKRT